MKKIARLTKKIFPFLRRTLCSVCGAENAGFLPLPDFYRQQAAQWGYRYFGQGEMTALDTYSCRNCAASDRERLYAWWLNDTVNTGQLRQRDTMLHFAPEAALSAYIRNQKWFSSYQTADMSMEGVDHYADLQSLPFENEVCDFFICSHVLEHVNNDRAAVKELYRITRKGGSGILMAPICMAINQTLEDPSITDEGRRWQLFGQNDHVRLYSHDDYVKRILESGFHVNQLGQDHFGSKLFRQMGLKPTSILYIVNKL